MYWLRGRTLHTLGTKRPFTVKHVHETNLVVVPRSSGKERVISRSEIEGAFNELWISREVTMASIRDHHSEANPSYIAALLAQLPDVDFTTRPIRLFWKS